jgi:hypothetical protein
MKRMIYTSNSGSQLGFWSAALVAFLSAIFFFSLAFPMKTLMFGSSLLLAPAFVAMLVSIHMQAAPDRQIWSLLGLSFAIIYAVLSSLTYYIQLTFITNNYLPVTEHAVLPFVFIPGTPIFAQDMLGYAFMCAAMLVASPVFTGGRLERWIRWLFILHAVLFFVPTIAVPAVPLPVNESGSGLGDLTGRYANMLWSAYFTTTALLVATLFRQRRRQVTNSSSVRAGICLPRVWQRPHQAAEIYCPGRKIFGNSRSFTSCQEEQTG